MKVKRKYDKMNQWKEKINIIIIKKKWNTYIFNQTLKCNVFCNSKKLVF